VVRGARARGKGLVRGRRVWGAKVLNNQDPIQIPDLSKRSPILITPAKKSWQAQGKLQASKLKQGKARQGKGKAKSACIQI